jgi:hypothetical protein
MRRDFADDRQFMRELPLRRVGLKGEKCRAGKEQSRARNNQNHERDFLPNGSVAERFHVC